MAELIHKGGNKYRVRVFCKRIGRKKIYCYDQTLTFDKPKDARKFAEGKQTDHDRGLLHQPKPEARTVAAHLDDWLAHKRGKVEPNTHAGYKEMLDYYVRPAVGALQLADLTPRDVQGVYDAMLARGLSARTIRYAHTVLNAALDKAVWWRHIESNPARYTERPKGRKAEISFLQADEAQKFLAAARADRLSALFHLALANGLRPEEYQGLTWADVDLDKATLQVRRVLVELKGGGWQVRDYGKTDAARRTLVLEPEIVAALREHRARQNAERLAAGRKYQRHGFVFATPQGGPLARRNIHRRHFTPTLERAGLNAKLHLYCLRHTFATLSIAAGADAKHVSYALGHESVNFTLDNYVHAVEGMKLKASGQLGRMLFAERK